MIRGMLWCLLALFAFGVSQASAKISCAKSQASYKTHVIDLDKIKAEEVKQKVIRAIEKQEMTPDFVKITFAGSVGKLIRDSATLDPNIYFKEPMRLGVSAIKTDEKANILAEQHLWAGQAAKIAEVKFGPDLAAKHHLRLVVPAKTVGEYAVVFPLEAPATGLPEARTFTWDWGGDCTMNYYVVVSKAFEPKKVTKGSGFGYILEPKAGQDKKEANASN